MLHDPRPEALAVAVQSRGVVLAASLTPALSRREREQDPAPSLALLPECIGDATHLPSLIHQQHIEPHPGPAPFGMLTQHECRRGQQPSLLP